MKKNLIVFVGPTAVGKTALSIDIAKKFNTEIVSADSRQFYKELNVGTAKPSPNELMQAKHYFINSHSVHDEYNVGKYEEEAIARLQQLFQKQNIVVMAGGSGLYINAICTGFDKLPDAAPSIRTELQNTLQTKGIEALQKQLQQLDVVYFQEVDKNNPHRLIRAIEVCLISGEPYSTLRKKTKQKRFFFSNKIGLTLPKEELYERINKRVDKMFENGLLQEAQNLYPYKHLNALETVGYTELFEYIENKISLSEAIDKIKQNTRKYAKRQMTWFKKDKEIQWFHPEGKEEIEKYIEDNLK